MQCSWCHGAILEDPRSISEGVTVHYWCVDFFEEKLTLIPDAIRRVRIAQAASMAFRRLRLHSR